MGRRKIEIQPITHERNRSVTFLKRKNGLFKKAYELGVLCSVDVAVIIFETRPGHEVKLHEYSSSDIRNIVQRQTRHQGDIDLKIPADFSGSASKFDDVGDADGDDDNGDEEEDLPVAKPSRRRGRGGLALPTNTDDYNAPLPPPPPPAHQLHPESAGVALLSVANDRVSNMRDLRPPRPSKRPRNARSRSPSEDTMVPSLPAINSEWGLSQDEHGLGRYGRNIRHLPPPPPGPSQQQQDHQHQYHSMHQQQHPGHEFQYTPLFPVSNQVSPPPAFVPLQQDFGSSRSLPPFNTRPGGSGGAGSGTGYADLHQRMRPSDSAGYDSASYAPNANSMTRHSEHHHHHQSLLSHPPPPPPFHTQPATAAAAHRREDRSDGLVGNLLETDERGRQRSGTGAGAGLDWPMHDGLTLPQVGRSGASSTGPTGPRGSLDGPGVSNPTNGSSDSWFDFLSRSNAAVNESHGNSSRRNSSSTWPRNSGDLDTNQKSRDNDNNNNNNNSTGGLFDGRKESAVRGEGDVGDIDIPILRSPEERIGVEGDVVVGNGQVMDDERSEGDKT